MFIKFPLILLCSVALLSLQFCQKVKIKEKAPVKSAPETSALEHALRKSDDYNRYRSKFLKASKLLIDKGYCTIADFEEVGGWWRSTRMKSTYFTYCGELHLRNRLYLNVETGKIFQ